MRAAYGLLRGRLPKSKSPLFVVDSFSLVRYTGGVPEPTPAPAEEPQTEEPATELSGDDSATAL